MAGEDGRRVDGRNYEDENGGGKGRRKQETTYFIMCIA